MVSVISSFLKPMISYLYKIFKHIHMRKVIANFLNFFAFFYPILHGVLFIVVLFFDFTNSSFSFFFVSNSLSPGLDSQWVASHYCICMFSGKYTRRLLDLKRQLCSLILLGIVNTGWIFYKIPDIHNQMPTWYLLLHVQLASQTKHEPQRLIDYFTKFTFLPVWECLLP